MGWDDGIWDGIWDGMGVGILPFPLIWVASIDRPSFFLSLILNANYNDYTIRKDSRNRVGNGQLGLITIMNCQIYITEEFEKNLKIQMKTDCSSGMTYRIVTWELC